MYVVCLYVCMYVRMYYVCTYVRTYVRSAHTSMSCSSPHNIDAHSQSWRSTRRMARMSSCKNHPYHHNSLLTCAYVYRSPTERVSMRTCYHHDPSVIPFSNSNVWHLTITASIQAGKAHTTSSCLAWLEVARARIAATLHITLLANAQCCDGCWHVKVSCIATDHNGVTACDVM